jgi:anti-sigma factor RsiW
MPCEHFQDALIEAAATRAEPQGEVRVHLQNCAACQAAFEQEQSLFASIDAGVRVVANAEVPPSLMPRVRAALDEIVAPKPVWSPKWFVLAGASAMLAFFFVTQALWRSRFEPQPTESAGKPAPFVPPAHVATKITPGAMLAANPSSVAHHTRAALAKVSLESKLSDREAQAEILVPRDQEVMLARYAEEWRGRKPAPMVVAASNESTVAPLEVAPIQIAELDVKPLAETQAQ